MSDPVAWAPFGGAAVLVILIASTSGDTRISFIVLAAILVVGFTLSATIWKNRGGGER